MLHFQFEFVPVQPDPATHFNDLVCKGVEIERTEIGGALHRNLYRQGVLDIQPDIMAGPADRSYLAVNNPEPAGIQRQRAGRV